MKVVMLGETGRVVATDGDITLVGRLASDLATRQLSMVTVDDGRFIPLPVASDLATRQTGVVKSDGGILFL
jgi:hypothetical protein